MKILNQRLQITDKSINLSIRQFMIENTKTFKNITTCTMMKENYQAYNSVQNKNYIGFLNVKFEEDVNIIDTIHRNSYTQIMG